ncbi:MAG: Lpg1974 family pore-forming outer membrane protein [Chlamydiota bacterium]
MTKKELQISMIAICAMFPMGSWADQATQATSGYLQGEKVKNGQIPAGYNQNAGYSVEDGHDVYFTADYIYWHLSNHVALGTSIVAPSLSSAALTTGVGNDVGISPSYKSGFQVGMGLALKGMDDWNLYGEYTWYENNTSASVEVAPGDIFIMTAGPLGNQFIPLSVLADSVTGQSIFHYTTADLALQRNFYLGKKLTAKFGCGLRARWIHSKATVGATGLQIGAPSEAISAYSVESGSLKYSFTQHSWALGPRFELASNWLLGCGFRIMGDIAASILYTKYTNLDSYYKAGTAIDYANSDTGTARLRPIAETSLGLGWGMYCGANNNYHFDFSAAYEFNVHWSQTYDIFGVADDIYLHGLNIAARFDF